MKRYKTTDEIAKKFIEDGWSDNTSFSELSLEEATERKLMWAVNGIINGHKYFVMNICGNIYDDKGKLMMLNI